MEEQNFIDKYLSQFAISANCTILDALRCIDKKFCYPCGSDGKNSGVMTDGDIRRIFIDYFGEVVSFDTRMFMGEFDG